MSRQISFLKNIKNKIEHQYILYFILIFSVFLFSGCNNNNHLPVANHNAAAITPDKIESDSIIISNIEIRPNPYHLFPNPNFKAGDCSVIVSVMNIGKVPSTNTLFFTLKFNKADNAGNFNTPEITIGGSTFKDQILSNETKYVTIPYDSWLTLQTAQGNFNSVIGTYKVRISMEGDTHINPNFPQPLFEIVNG